jgi:hypothetical protein
MLTVACVWRSGPEYLLTHVIALATGIQERLTMPHRFFCLTDCGAVAGQVLIRCGIEPVPLKHGWPGWWSKIELFRPGLFNGPVFYADLDTLIVGSLDDLVLGHRFTLLRNFWADRQGEDRVGSGVMAWDADLRIIYERFCQAPERTMQEFVTTERWGDQAFIKLHSPFEPDRWQDKHPGRIVSYKRDVRPAGRIPDGASVIAFHGEPRPWDTPLWKQLEEQRRAG